MKRSIKLAYIGSGPISNFHIPAINKTGFEIVEISSRPNSVRCKEIAAKYDLQTAYNPKGWRSTLDRADAKFEGIVIAVDTRVTPEILEEAIKLGKPIFCEKPGAWHPAQLERLEKLEEENGAKIFFAYNRRFYDTVSKIKRFIKNSESGTINVSIPDSIGTIRQFLVNGCHMIDLVVHILEGAEIRYTDLIRDKEEEIVGFVAVLKGNNAWTSIIEGNWEASANFEIRASSRNEVYKLMPVEKLEVFKKMVKIEPSKEIPIRRYEPVSDNVYIEEATLKPGFIEQYKAFHNYCESRVIDSRMVDLKQAIHSLSMCHDIIKDAKLTQEQFQDL